VAIGYLMKEIVENKVRSMTEAKEEAEITH
jgi:hypothetical protein